MKRDRDMTKAEMIRCLLKRQKEINGYHYTEYTLVIVIEDDTIARIQTYTMNKQI